VIGGGARNPLWNQIKADVLGVPFQRLRRSEFATWGCALIAGYAVGLFNDLAGTAEAAIEQDGVPFQPDERSHKKYTPLVTRYLETLARLKEIT
jgi:xylulokinase